MRILKGLRRKWLWHQLWLFCVLLVLSGFRIWRGTVVFDSRLMFWWIGALFGFVFLFTDRFFYILTEKWENLRSKNLFSLFVFVWREIASGEILSERKNKLRLIMRSELFVALYLVLGFWVMTSGVSVFGKGFVLGLGLHLVLDLLSDYLDKDRGIDHWLWHLQRKLNLKEKKIFVWGVTFLFALIGLGL